MTAHDGPVIRGGAGMTRVNLDQLDTAADAFRAVAREVASVWEATQGAQNRISATASLSYDSFLRAAALHGTLQDGPASMPQLARRSDEIAERLMLAKRQYLGAETDAMRFSDALRRLSVSWLWGSSPILLLSKLGHVMSLLMQLGRLAGGEWLRFQLTGELDPQLARRFDELVGDLSHILGVDLTHEIVVQLISGKQDIHSIAGLIGPRLGIIVEMLARPERYEFTQRGTTRPRSAATSLSDLIERTGENHPDSDADGPHDSLVIQVDKVIKADGTTAFTVIVPGMQAGADPDHPLDEKAVLQLVGGHPTVVQRAIEDALAAAGATSQDPVLLVGHSGGGMAAAAFASSAAARKFNVKAVVTAGSPTAGIPTAPPQVQTLHLASRRDPIIGADGGQNKAAPNTLTFISDGTLAPDQYHPTPSNPETHGERSLENFVRRFTDAHRTRTYVGIAEEFEQLRGEPSSAHMQQVLSEFMSDDGAVATNMEFDVKAIPVPPDPPAPKPDQTWLTPAPRDAPLRPAPTIGEELRHGIPARLD